MQCICCQEELIQDGQWTCKYCKFTMCIDCLHYGILQEVSEPKCLNCKHVVQCQEVMELSERTWLVDEFLPHMGKFLLEKEKLLLPYTQDEAKKTMKLAELREKVRELPTDKQLQRKYKKNFEEEKKNKDKVRQQLLAEIKELNGTSQSTSTSEKRVVFISKCMQTDCKGYINEDYICSTCDTLVCASCLIKQEDKHKCTKEDLSLAEIIKNQCKACPKCYIPIMKAGGCDQMWCINCHTTFSWQTGQIDKGPNHNPHFYEWAAQHATNNLIQLEELACGNLPTYNDLIAVCRFYWKIDMNQFWPHKFTELHRLINHIQTVALASIAENRVRDNMDLRIAYLCDQLHEEDWERKLIVRERRRMKNQAQRDICNMFILVGTDIIRRIVARVTHPNNANKECIELRKYVKDLLNNVLTVHGGSLNVNIKILASV